MRLRLPHPRLHWRAFHDWRTSEERRGFDYAASGWAGLVGGATLVLLEFALAPVVLGLEPRELTYRVAAMVMGERRLVPMAGFDGLMGLTAMVVHLPLSLVYARVIAGVVHAWRPRPAVLFGAAFGVLIYFVNFHGFISLFPWMEWLRGWPTLLAHVAYGATTAGVYEALMHAKD